VIPVAVAFSLASPLIGGEIVFEAEPTATYLVLHSFNLCHWQEILRVKSQQSGPMAFPSGSITRKASGESRVSPSRRRPGTMFLQPAERNHHQQPTGACVVTHAKCSVEIAVVMP
jgi:hypothetical protein